MILDTDDRLLIDVREVARLLTVKPRTVWRLVATGRLPPPVRIPGLRATRWRRSEVENWCSSLRVARPAGSPVRREVETVQEVA